MKTQGELALMVSDSGCGISEAEQATLFHRYAQARQGRQQTGSGLGLVICKSWFALMQGRLEMVSRPGVGTTFTITLPVKARAAARSTRRRRRPARPQALPGLAILIADDHPTNRLLLQAPAPALSAIASMKPATVKRQRISSPANITIC